MRSRMLILGIMVMGNALPAAAQFRANFSIEGERVAPATLQFRNTSDGADRFEWDFGDGTTSAEVEPTHRYRSSGNFQVTLTAYKGKRRKKTKRQRIYVRAPERCLVELETPYGNMLIHLFDGTPKHQDNFFKLAEEGFYDSLLFHRVINGFMIQGGDPLSKDAPPETPLGAGGPGYTIEAEFVDSLVHLRGMLAAARKGDQVNPLKQSSGSQFYIVQGRTVTEEMLDRLEVRKGIRYTPDQRQAYLERGGTPFLDGEYTVFGEVIEGLEVIDKIAKVATDANDRPTENVIFTVHPIK